ncbi:MAG: TerD family protein [Deltaproteobacteria bacterium]|jgi:tellurium resistance protein TerD|nr:TerD family protein [Deltaproteobacteria bacterium]
MGVQLKKGANVSLIKEAPGLKAILVGLGWDARATAGADFDLDASAFLLRDDGKTRRDTDFVFYGNLTTPDGTVEHTGDNLTGGGGDEGDQDDEAIKIDLEKVPPDIARIAVTVSIYDAEKRHQNFGMVSNAYIRVLDQAGGKEIARFDLTEDMSTETAMIFGEVYRHQGNWKFKAVGQGFTGGLMAMCEHFGIEVSD